MQIKIFEINTDSVNAIEEEINNWLINKRFSFLQISKVIQNGLPRIGVRIYVIYELEVGPSDEQETE